jgi:transcriptional regulator with PAS, ATPase and Fis domain
MKQPISPSTPVVDPTWLAQFDSSTLLKIILDLSKSLAFYIVDNTQQVLYWSEGMEAFTGLLQVDLIGKRCPEDCMIDVGSNDRQRVVMLSKADGNKIELMLVTQILHDTKGTFAGGIGMLTDVAQSSPDLFQLQASATSKQNFHGIISRSLAMRDVFQIIQNAAETEATVLVRGESGSGKELVAKAIHSLSTRHNGPFLAINCAALSSNLLESELFGHVRGAFTGAIKDHSGLFQRASGGTLFLDEVAELPLDLQAKLLRVIQERNFIPVGGDRSVQVDVRIVAATHRSLREEVKKSRFREDLMYRLRVVPIFLPPLRERREDISLLIWHFIQRHNTDGGRKIEKIDPDAMRLLLDYQWPGNIRELHNVVQYAFAVGRGATLRLPELPPEFREQRVFDATKQVRQSRPLAPEDEISALRKALAQCHGQAGKAASPHIS